MKILKQKKGELTTQQIVMLIILITSFAVILFFFFRLNLGEETDKELCRNSVVLKGSSVLPSDSTPLNCYRSYECLTKDGTCEGITNPEVEKVDNLEDIYQKLAENMASCWWMFGEGKIDYIGTGLTKNNYCSICSQILFDDSLEEIKDIKKGIISKDKLYDYLAITKMPRKDINYAEYFFGTNDVEKIKTESGVDSFGNIEIKKQYFVVMGITSEIGGTYKWLGSGISGIAIVSLFIPGVNIVTSSIILVSGVATGTVGAGTAELFESEILALTVKGKGIENQFMAPTIVEAESKKFKDLSCQEILTFT